MKKLFIIGLIFALVLTMGCIASSQDNKEAPATVQEQQTEQKQVQQVEQNVTEKQTFAAVSAMEWFGIAKEESLRWRVDAKLIEVEGKNKGTHATYPIDGKTDTWKYYFVSIGKDQKYLITIIDGEINKTEVIGSTGTRTLFDSVPSDSEWNIDSISAINTVNTRGGGDVYLKDNPLASATYDLKFDNSPSATWIIGYNPKNLGTYLLKHVNAITNEISS